MYGTRAFSLNLPADSNGLYLGQLTESRLISEPRRQKARGLRFPGDRLRALASELLLVIALSDLGVKIDAPLVISTGPHGKPHLDDYPDIEFNISHSGEYVACAISDSPVGIDIEHAADIATDSLLAELCSENERCMLEALPYDERRERFYLLWTAKESITKALGFGLSMPLPSIELEALASRPRDILIAKGPLTYQGLKLDYLRIDPRYPCYLASDTSSPFLGLTPYPWTELLH